MIGVQVDALTLTRCFMLIKQRTFDTRVLRPRLIKAWVQSKIPTIFLRLGPKSLWHGSHHIIMAPRKRNRTHNLSLHDNVRLPAATKGALAKELHASVCVVYFPSLFCVCVRPLADAHAL